MTRSIAPATALGPYSMGARPRVTSIRSIRPRGQQRKVGAAIPGGGQRRTVEKYQRLAFLGAADARHGLAARIGAHEDTRDRAKDIGHRDGLAYPQCLVVEHQRRTRSACRPARGGENDFLHRPGALPLSQRRCCGENPGYGVGQTHDGPLRRRYRRRRRNGSSYKAMAVGSFSSSYKAMGESSFSSSRLLNAGRSSASTALNWFR